MVETPKHSPKGHYSTYFWGSGNALRVLIRLGVSFWGVFDDDGDEMMQGMAMTVTAGMKTMMVMVMMIMMMTLSPKPDVDGDYLGGPPTL